MIGAMPQQANRTAPRIVSAVLALAASAALASPAAAQCSQPISDGDKPTIGDCIYIARATIADLPCSACICDADGSGDVGIRDALRCLRSVLGSNVTLDCPACEATTTTLPACASCNDVLVRLAEPEDLCEQSQPVYDALVDWPCDRCATECSSGL